MASPTNSQEFQQHLIETLGKDGPNGQSNYDDVIDSLLASPNYKSKQLLLEMAFGRVPHRQEIVADVSHTVMVTEWVTDYHPGEITKEPEELEVVEGTYRELTDEERAEESTDGPLE